MRGRIQILHVDDDPDFLDLTATYLQQEDDIVVTTATSATEGLALLDERSFDCVVSDFRMPGMDGLEFLETVRGRDQEMPFVLFTGEGSEDIAADAISAGVTDYLRKGSGTDQYTLLANRVRNAVESYQAQQAVETTQRRFKRLLEHSADYVIVVDEDGRVEYVSPSVERVLGYGPAEIEGKPVLDIVHPDDVATAQSDLETIRDAPGEALTSEIRAVAADGTHRWVEVKARNLLSDPAVRGIVGNVRDITERKEQAAAVDWHRTVIQSMAAGVYVIDSDRTFQFVNFRVEDPGPLHESDWVGRDVSALRESGVFSAEDTADIEAALTDVLSGEREETRLEVEPTLPPEAETLELRLTAVEVPGQERMALGTTRDVSAQRRRERRITALHDATREFVASETPEEVARRAVETIEETLGVPLNAVYFYDEAADALVPAATAGADVVEEAPTYTGGESLLWDVFQADEARYIADVSAHPDCYNPETPLRTELMLPLSDHGVVTVADTEVDAFDESTRMVARTLAANAEAALTRVKRTASLRESERRYETLVENFPDGAVFLFDEDLRYTLAGGTELSAVGLSAEEMEGRRFEETLPASVVERQESAYRAALDGEERVFEQSFRGEHYRVRILPIEDDDGTVQQGMAVVENVTDRHERERRLQRQNERLEQFASVISHDIRNPLRVAAGNLDLAAETGDMERLDTAREALGRIDDIIDRTLSLARSGDAIGETEPVAIDEVAPEWWRAVDSGGVSLEVEDPPTVTADPDRLRQLFENLVGNGVKHGGDVVRIGGTDDGFYVADDGPGVPPDERESVFDAGYSTDDRGAGLGLAIVEDIAAAHGWSVRVTESRDGGARFEITTTD